MSVASCGRGTLSTACCLCGGLRVVAGLADSSKVVFVPEVAAFTYRRDVVGRDGVASARIAPASVPLEDAPLQVLHRPPLREYPELRIVVAVLLFGLVLVPESEVGHPLRVRRVGEVAFVVGGVHECRCAVVRVADYGQPSVSAWGCAG